MTPPITQTGTTQYISVREAARLFNYDADYIARLCRQGKISGFRKNKNWVVDRDSAHAFFQEHGERMEKWHDALSKEMRAVGNQTTPISASTTEHAVIVRPHSFFHLRAKQRARRTHTLQHAAVSVMSLFVFAAGAFAFELVAPEGSVGRAILVHTAERASNQIAAASSLPFVDSLASLVYKTLCPYIGWCETESTVPDYLSSHDPQTTTSQKTAAVTSTPPQPPRTPQVVVQNVTSQPVVERVIETTRVVTEGGISESLLDARLYGLEQKLTSQILSSANTSSSQITQVFTTVGAMGRIEHLDELDLTDPTISNATITGGTIASLSSPLAIGSGGTGTSTAPTYGKMLVGNANSGYDLTATSSLGLPTFSDLVSASGQAWEIFNGAYLAPTTTLGVIVSASSTIGNGTRAGGLTISGGATTTATSTLAGLVVTSGNVGIGTVSPGAKLDISGGALLLDNNQSVQFRDGGSLARVALKWDSSADAVQLGNSSWNPSLQFFTTGGERMRITDTGNVGIGTTSPWAKFSVDSSSLGTVPAFVVGSSTATQLVVTNGGNVGIGSTSPSAKLDISGGTVTSNLPALAFDQTWNESGTTFTGLRGNINNTSSGASSMLMNLQINGGDQFKVLAPLSGASAFGAFTIQPNVNFGNSYIGHNGGQLYFNTNCSSVGCGVGLANASSNYFTLWSGGYSATAGDASFNVPTTNALGISTAGAEQMRITGAGKFGIGTTSPYAKFSIHASSTETNTTLFAVASSTASATTTHFVVTNAGNVGIGTTSPWGKLSLTNTGSGPSFVVEDDTSPDTTPFIIDTSGNVGIGTASPSEELHLAGSSNMAIRIESIGVNGYIEIKNPTTNGSPSQINIETDDNDASQPALTINAFTSNNDPIQSAKSVLSLANDGTALFDLKGSGNVGIGTTSPYAKLSVVGPVVAEYFHATSTSATSTFAGGFAVETSGLVYDFSTNAVGIGTASPTGKLQVVGGDIVLDAGQSLDFGGTTFDAPRLRTTGGGNLVLTVGGGTVAFTREGSLTGGLQIDNSIYITPTAGTPAFSFVTDTNTGISNPTADTLNFYTGGTEYARITSAGNVGIGTTTPWAKLSVGTHNLAVTTPSFVIASSSTGVATSTQFVVTNGKVGIGTASPSQPFVITTDGTLCSGNTCGAVITDTDSSDFASVQVTNDNAISAFLQVGGTGVGAFANVASLGATNGITLLTNNSAASGGTDVIKLITGGYNNDPTMTITAGNPGTVGIATTSPWGLLAVEQSTENYSFIVSNTGSSTPSFAVSGVNGNGRVLIGTTTIATSTSALLLMGGGGNAGAVAMFANDSGNCYINPTSTSLSCSSDARLKKNIETLSPALPALMRLRPVTYNWNVEADGVPTHTGFIAQEVAELLPDLVSADDFGYLSLNYAGFTPYLVLAAQDINLRLEAIASTTVPTTPDSQSFADSFFSNLFVRIGVWLADAANGIAAIFTQKLTTNELCVDDICVTREQFAAVFGNGTHSSGQTASAATPPPSVPASESANAPQAEPEEQATSTPFAEPVAETSPAEEPPAENPPAETAAEIPAPESAAEEAPQAESPPVPQPEPEAAPEPPPPAPEEQSTVPSE